MTRPKRVLRLLCGILSVPLSRAITVPSSAPPSAVPVDPSLLSVSLEFFAFPGYAALPTTANCLANMAALRGAPPAVRIGGTTQDRATFYPNLNEAVNYTVASPADAPTSLTFGPPFIALAAQLPGEVTLGLNRQLDNRSASLAAAVLAKQTMPNLFAIELGNEPEYYASSSPIIVDGGKGWSQSVDAASQKSWFQAFAGSVRPGDSNGLRDI